MDETTKKLIGAEMDEWTRLINAKIENLHQAIDKRFEAMKKVVGDYLELSSNISIGSVKTNLKNV